MGKVTDRYWAAYEKAVDMKIQKVIDQIDPKMKTMKNSIKFRELVKQGCSGKFLYIDEHRDSFKVVAIMIERLDFHGFPTNEVYDLYCRYCEHFNFKVIKKGYFTKFVCDYFGYSVIDKRLNRLNGKKQRLFIKKAGE